MLDRAWLQHSFEVNAIGPLLMMKAFAPMLTTRGELKNRPPPVVANLSARVGSIGDNRLGGWYSYRSSKAALNQATKTAALELGRRGGWAVALHPGTCATNLSAPFQKGVPAEKLFPVERGAAQLLDVIEGLEPADNGGFFSWGGTEIVW